MIYYSSQPATATNVTPLHDSMPSPLHLHRHMFLLRMKEGDEVTVVDGKGSRFRCAIVEAHPKHTAVEIISRESVPNHWGFELTLAVAPTKHSDRMEWMLATLGNNDQNPIPGAHRLSLCPEHKIESFLQH